MDFPGFGPALDKKFVKGESILEKKIYKKFLNGESIPWVKKKLAAGENFQHFNLLNTWIPLLKRVSEVRKNMWSELMYTLRTKTTY